MPCHYRSTRRSTQTILSPHWRIRSSTTRIWYCNLPEKLKTSPQRKKCFNTWSTLIPLIWPHSLLMLPTESWIWAILTSCRPSIRKINHENPCTSTLIFLAQSHSIIMVSRWSIKPSKIRSIPKSWWDPLGKSSEWCSSLKGFSTSWNVRMTLNVTIYSTTHAIN